MGNLSTILVLSAILAGGALAYNLQGTTRATVSRTSEYQHQVLARDLAFAGLHMATKDLSSSVFGGTPLATTPGYPRNEVSHAGGTYSVSISQNCGILLPGEYAKVFATYPPNSGLQDFVEVVSRGKYDAHIRGDEHQEHEVRACYVRSMESAGAPPSFEFAFISDKNFDFNGGPDIVSVEVDGEGNVHSNSNMDLGPQVNIEGHATYVDPNGSKAHKNTQVYSFGQGERVPLEKFDPEVYRPAGAHTFMTGSYSVSGTEVIGSSAYTADNPFIWFVDGNLTVGGNNHLILPGHTIIVVKGILTISGTANVTAIPELPPHKGSQEEMREWIYRNLTEDGKNKIAFYVDGNATVGGTGQVIGNFYTNGNFTLNGGGNGSNLVGAVQALGTITANGGGNGNNFWYTGAHESVIIPGVAVPGKDRLTLVAISEWTDPILDHVGS